MDTWTFLAVILFAIIKGILTQSQVCEFYKSVELVNQTYNGVQFELNEYFVDNTSGVERGCVCLKGTCARKCCPLGQKLDLDLEECTDISEPFDPPVRDGSSLKEGFNATDEFIFMFGIMSCSWDKGENLVAVASRNVSLMMDGNLYVQIPSNVPPAIIYGPDKYCIDTFVQNGVTHLNALICFKEEEEKPYNYLVSSTCMLISCFFILLTVAVYAWLPELRNLHGMVLMAYLMSFFVGFLFLATMQILTLTNQTTEENCTVLTFFVYFFLLSAFFWLNVMCYDIWWTFSGKRANGRDKSPLKRFLGYGVYSFGVPTVLTIILAALEFSDLPIQHPFMPNIRTQSCFLHGTSKLLYLYGPIVILCIANMIFFTLTALNIAKIKRETKMLHSKDSSTTVQDKKDQQRFGLYVKLFTLMGINWILEVISSFYPEANFYWQFTDAYNVLVGLIIFIIFVCKKKTLEMIKKRIKDFQRFNACLDSREIKRDSNKTMKCWQMNKERKARLDTIKTTVEVETNTTRNEKLDDVLQLHTPN